MRRIFILVCIICLVESHKAMAQLVTNDTTGGHESWEFVLEGTGDVLQIALPLTAGMITIIDGDYQGTRQLAYSYASALALTYSLK